MMPAVIVLIMGAVVFLWLYGERWRPILPSTRALIGHAGVRPLFNGDGLHAYFYARWTNTYLRMLIHRVFPRLGAAGKRWLADGYHGKVLTHDHATAIIKVERDIPLQDLEQIVPYARARDPQGRVSGH